VGFVTTMSSVVYCSRSWRLGVRLNVMKKIVGKQQRAALAVMSSNILAWEHTVNVMGPGLVVTVEVVVLAAGSLNFPYFDYVVFELV